MNYRLQLHYLKQHITWYIEFPIYYNHIKYIINFYKSIIYYYYGFDIWQIQYSITLIKVFTIIITIIILLLL